MKAQVKVELLPVQSIPRKRKSVGQGIWSGLELGSIRCRRPFGWPGLAWPELGIQQGNEIWIGNGNGNSNGIGEWNWERVSDRLWRTMRSPRRRQSHRPVSNPKSQSQLTTHWARN